ncbi:uncharacterized protein ASPGLDRAFT_624841 [Aspergillus glaucus CBS 516.65]|uniref:Uncharacterized protein n=1 Tax=Aspergillus glaucus CBS 516.65 TaxID=1160497 RepID=A0A1L9VCA8_ASPGL|nr:hypothetical protein ASPGLDRAFT_624841 [Aspergillus glaucus CBS 516.65]OJJ81550.1 hypothetical protein ASPGLDRAFT_624841 [Aspergillus glaucus CBS 516.65]
MSSGIDGAGNHPSSTAMPYEGHAALEPAKRQELARQGHQGVVTNVMETAEGTLGLAQQEEQERLTVDQVDPEQAWKEVDKRVVAEIALFKEDADLQQQESQGATMSSDQQGCIIPSEVLTGINAEDQSPFPAEITSSPQAGAATFQDPTTHRGTPAAPSQTTVRHGRLSRPLGTKKARNTAKQRRSKENLPSGIEQTQVNKHTRRG